MPVAVYGDREFTQITAGTVVTCALDVAGQAHCWGKQRACGLVYCRSCGAPNISTSVWQWSLTICRMECKWQLGNWL